MAAAGKPIREEARPRAGRPTRDQQARRLEALLEAALDAFLHKGFEAATVDEIAAGLGMSKRTVYARFPDKAALFRAAVARAAERYTVPRPVLDALARPALAETLAAVARLRVANAATPEAVRLQRVLAAQSGRFPDIGPAAFEAGAAPTVDFLTELFAARTAAGEIDLPEPRRAAVAFLSLVVGGLVRGMVLGLEPGPEEVDRQVAFAVDLFLKGALTRG